MYDTDRKLHDILTALLPTLKWLNVAGSVDVHQVPPEHTSAIKQLDVLGLVYKRNARTYGLQRERLRKLIMRIGGQVAHPSCHLLNELFGTTPIALDRVDQAVSTAQPCKTTLP